jgi:hypothetical protein
LGERLSGSGKRLKRGTGGEAQEVIRDPTVGPANAA